MADEVKNILRLQLKLKLGDEIKNILRLQLKVKLVVNDLIKLINYY